MYPYKVQLVQSLQPLDMQQWLTYAIRIQKIARNDINIIHNLIIGGEARFHLNGHVNKQNMRFWVTENPRIAYASELHPRRVTVWGGVSLERIIGPYFFKDPDKNAVTVTGERYREMLENFVQLEIANMAGYWWQ